MVLDSLGQSLPASTSTSLVSMNVALFDTSKADGRSQLGSDLVDYLGRGGARRRGSSTGSDPKANMTFETWGTEGTNQDDDDAASLLGMSSDADWVLHAPGQYDRTRIRNQLAFDLSNRMDMWASDYRHVELYMNNGDGVVDASDYMGIYVLEEKIEQGSGRVDIAEIDPEDNAEPEISGGYIWKVDRADPGDPSFVVGSDIEGFRAQALNWVYPKSPGSETAREDQKATVEQEAWVVNYFNQFINTLASPDINDPNGYSKYIDPVSWVDHHMLNVLDDERRRVTFERLISLKIVRA